MTVTANTKIYDNNAIHIRRHISALASLAESDAPVLSAYFDLRSPLETQQTALNVWFISETQGLTKNERAMLNESKAEVISMLRQAWPTGTQSLAIFSRNGKNPYNMALSFEAAMETQFYARNRPAIFPLVQMKDRFHRFVLAICSEDTGRVVELNLGTPREDIHLSRSKEVIELDRHEGRENHAHRRMEEAKRFARELAHVIRDLMTRQGLTHLIIAGSPRSVSAVRDQLPKHLQSCIVDALPHAPNGHDCSTLIDEAIQAFVSAEQEESRRTVEKMYDQVLRNGLAVVGIHACRDAIACGAASQLVISEELHHDDREDLVHMATLRDLPIEVCENDALILSHGGVGCLLRFRMEYMQPPSLDG